MASSSSAGSPAPPAPKILLAKPGLVSGAAIAPKFGRGAPSDDDAASLRPRLPPIGSLNLLSDSWDFHFDRFLPFLTENTDFTVIGVIGPAGVGKSTIMNQLYGFDPASPGMLPPFATQSDDTRAMGKHCSNGIEPRVSADRLILLDTQPVFSSSVLAEMIRPDGSSTIPVLGNESLSAELAHEIMSIQLGVLLSSICHILLIVSEGVHDNSIWRLMLTVDLLKHGIPDPSSLITTHTQTTNLGLEKEYKDKLLGREEYMAAPFFVHTKLHDQEMNLRSIVYLRKAFAQCFRSSSFMREKHDDEAKLIDYVSACTDSNVRGSTLPNISLIPSKNSDDSSEPLYESYNSALWKLRDQVLSMSGPTFTRTVSERDWLRNTAKIWELVKNSSIIGEYAKTLQNSGTFRR